MLLVLRFSVLDQSLSGDVGSVVCPVRSVQWFSKFHCVFSSRPSRTQDCIKNEQFLDVLRSGGVLLVEVGRGHITDQCLVFPLAQLVDHFIHEAQGVFKAHC